MFCTYVPIILLVKVQSILLDRSRPKDKKRYEYVGNILGMKLCKAPLVSCGPFLIKVFVTKEVNRYYHLK